MDDHYLVISITSDIQHYFNQSLRTDTTNTLDPTIMYTHKMQQMDKPNCYLNEPDQVLADIKQQLLQTQTRMAQ